MVLLATAARAQRVTGVVHDGRSSLPLSGAIVSIVSATGITLAQAISDRVGSYRLPVDNSGSRLILRRIGYLPHEVPLPDSAHTATATIDVTLDPVPAVLDPVVATETSCRPTPGEGQALALWEQAKLGFLATVVARNTKPANVTVAQREREDPLVPPDPGQSVNLLGFTSTRPFAATLTPEALVTKGFVTDDPAGRTYHGLDADLLVSDAFHNTHCFDLAAPDTGHRGQVGIAFTPTLGRANLPEVAGTMWLDASPLALRSLVFRYVNVSPTEARGGVGGVFNFRTMDNGVVFIDDWQLRILSASAAEDYDLKSKRPPPTHVNGGVVISAVWTDGTRFAPPFPSIEGKVVETATAKPLAGIAVAIPNSSYSAVTGADGSFHIANVLPGSYTISAADSAWSGFGLARRKSAPVVIPAAGAFTLKLEMEPLLTTIQTRCKGSPAGHGTAIIAGRVRDSTGAAQKTKIELETSVFGTLVMGLSLSTTDDGYFSFCGLATGPTTFVAVDAKGRRTLVDAKLVDGINRVTLTIPRP